MSTTIRNVNAILAVSGLVMSILGLLHTMIGRFLWPKTRAYFIKLFIILSTYELTIIARELINNWMGDVWVAISYVLFLAQGILAATITIIITAFLLEQCGIQPYRQNIMFRISVVSYAVYVALMVANLFTGFLYYIDEHNVYTRGNWFPVLIIPTVVIMIINLVILWKYRERLSVWQIRAFLIYTVFPLLAMIIQAFLFGIHLIALSSVVAALFTLTYIIYDQTDRYYMMTVENEKLRTDMLLAQIQPHFIFNSLAVIRDICGKNPDTAEAALGEFADYLRYNMESIDSKGMITFEKELLHVRQYLALQSLRFPDEIEMLYDIEYTAFIIPMLTLQPIVENAVTHGIRESESGKGKVTLAVRKTDAYITIIVADTGRGFDAKIIENDAGFQSGQNDEPKRSHIGIRNVKRRIETMTGGTLTIESAIGEGTSVTITLPTEG